MSINYEIVVCDSTEKVTEEKFDPRSHNENKFFQCDFVSSAIGVFRFSLVINKDELVTEY